MSDKLEEKIKVNEEMKNLVIARIEAQPSNLVLSIGSYGKMSKEDMIEHIQRGDETGKRIIESHIRFLRAQAAGLVTKALTSIE